MVNQKKVQALSGRILNIFKILALEPKLNFIESEQLLLFNQDKILFELNKNKMNIVGINVLDNFFNQLSPLEDDFVADEQIQNFIVELSKNGAILRLNHIGCCYPVVSIKEERERIKKEASDGPWKLYEEPSMDESAWLFVGDKSQWDEPLVELLPIEKTVDKWKDYWLPHFQIDVDTNLVAEDIEALVFKIFGDKIKPYRLVVVNDYVCIVRIRLGIVAGININLDLGTEGRMPRFQREKLLKIVK